MTMTPDYGTASSYTQEAHMPSYGRANPGYPSGRGGWVQKVGLGEVGVTPGLDPIVLGIIAVVGSSLGGAILGYFAQGSNTGAQVGASLSGGLTGMADAVLFAREQRSGAALIMGTLGLGLIGFGLYQSPAIKFGR